MIGIIPMLSVLYKSLDNKTFAVTKDSGIADYMRSIRSAVYGYWRGVYDEGLFFDAFTTAVDTGITRAWLAGAAKMGITRDELTTAEISARRAMIAEQLSYVDGFADAIAAGSKANGGKLAPLLKRAELWANKYNGAYNQAQLMAGQDQKMRWDVHAGESCTTCLHLNGRIYRASIWRKYDLRPQHPTRLQCMREAGGVPVCKCELSITDERVTPGYPPYG